MSGNKVRNSIFVLILIILAGLISYGFYKPYKLNFNQVFQQASAAEIVIFGDLMLDRNVANLIDKNGFDKFFSGISNLVHGADVAVANLEGPFTTYPSVTKSLKSKELKFTFDPSLAPKLADLGFDIFGLANNHTLNFGYEGLSMTKDFLNKAPISYYGDPDNEKELSVVVTVDNIKIGFVGFHEFSYKNFDRVFKEIEILRPQVDVLIVSPHWGPEYEKKPTEKMRQWAHDFIDSGADAVIGAHPHVVGEIEEYKEKKIYYSLGNFVFDQYFSEETMEGLGVIINVSKVDKEIGLDFKEVPIKVGREGVEML